MKAYLISVSVAVILSSVIDTLLPNKMQKYVSLFTSSLILIYVISPLSNLSGTNLYIKQPDNIKYNEYDINEIIIKEFKSNTKKDIMLRLKQEFSITCDADVEIDATDDNIRGIKKITIDTVYNENIKKRMSYIYGCNDIEFTRRM